MRSANLLNDFAFKYVFGEDCKEANDALKSLASLQSSPNTYLKAKSFNKFALRMSTPF